MCRRLLLLSAVLLCAAAAAAAEDASVEALARVATAKCAATAGERPTPQLIMAKVAEAARLIEQEGPAAFPRLRGDSPFIFNGTYVWVHDLDTYVMHVHPVRPRMEGRSVAGMTDVKGKAFFAEMARVLNEQGGSGWVDYVWPKPGEVDGSLKVSYVRKASFDGRHYVVGCGAYDLTLDDLKAGMAK
ncbi:MAG: cache domain-containing protein [Planctomycetes bacterium]|nr:cache domain-containing protein [Planctomycetota bacterium]